MKILIAGGTSFVGRAIALSAHAAGHQVTVINRGRTPSDLPTSIEHLIGDRTKDLSALDGRSFDATIDSTAYRPSDVDALGAALSGRGGHHLQISSVSAYKSPDFMGGTEDTMSLWSPESAPSDPNAPITGETYGPLKAACERRAAEIFGPVTIVRPTFVVGGHDASLRYPYWVARLARGGRVIVPATPAVAVQLIDARDLAHFCVQLVESATLGAFHTAGPNFTTNFLDLVEQTAAAVAPAGTELVHVDADVILASTVADKFPLWTGRDTETDLAVDASKAVAAGLTFRPLADTARETLDWWGDREWPAHWLSDSDEKSLLASL